MPLIFQTTDWHDQYAIGASVGIAGYTGENHQAGRFFHLPGIDNLAKLEQILSSFIGRILGLVRNSSRLAVWRIFVWQFGGVWFGSLA